MRIALVGQPNSGKSTLFNQVAGYRAETGNFSGTTVTFTESKVRVRGEVIELVDLPGTYTLSGMNPAERETFSYLASHQVDVIVNVIDASHLAQSLSLTLELLELSRPVAGSHEYDGRGCQSRSDHRWTGTAANARSPVLPLVASKGRGVRNLFVAAQQAGKAGIPTTRPIYSKDVEQAIQDCPALPERSGCSPVCRAGRNSIAGGRSRSGRARWQFQSGNHVCSSQTRQQILPGTRPTGRMGDQR